VGALIDSRRPTPGAVLALALIVALLVACGGGDGSARRVSVSDAWALATVTGQPNGAVYFTVLSTGADTLEQIDVPTSVADHAEIHATATGADGQMRMQELASGVTLEPGTAVTFTPGGMHVMLVDLVEPLAAGQSFDVTLEFTQADPITLPVAVLESAP
jgi:copper(I)-binding protein